MKTSKKKSIDLIIIGCGPGGMAASLYAARQKVNFICISKDVGGLATFIPHVETYLGYHYISGFNLVEKFQENLKEFNVKPILDEVKKVKRAREGISVKTSKGEYLAKAMIVASGRRFKKLDVKGEEKFENRGLSYCAACDGPLFKDKTVAIIGGGRSGLLSALFIKDIVKKIYLIEIKSEISGTETWRKAAKDAKNIEILTSTRTQKILGDHKVSGLLVEHKNQKKILRVDGVFVEIGYTPNTEFVKGVVELNDREEIIVDEENQTNVPGIFAAGDCTNIREKQVIVSAGEGAKAFLSALTYLGAYQEATTSLQSMMK